MRNVMDCDENTWWGSRGEELFTRWADAADVNGVIQLSHSVQYDPFSLHHSTLEQRELFLLQLLSQVTFTAGLFFFFLNTLFNRWPQRYSAQLLCCPYCKHGTIPVAVTGHVSFPAPCCSVASRAPVNSGAAEPVVWGRPAPPPVPSPTAATLPSLPAGLQVCCSSEYHSADKSSTE